MSGKLFGIPGKSGGDWIRGRCQLASFVTDSCSRDDPQCPTCQVAAEYDRLESNLRELIKTEQWYRANEQMALRRLSDALTGGAASTWDEVFTTADQVGCASVTTERSESSGSLQSAAQEKPSPPFPLDRPAQEQP